jgi:hypothetical protein
MDAAQGQLTHQGRSPPSNFEKNETKYLKKRFQLVTHTFFKRILMKTFQVQILVTVCEHCGGQNRKTSGLCPTHMFRALASAQVG